MTDVFYHPRPEEVARLLARLSRDPLTGAHRVHLPENALRAVYGEGGVGAGDEEKGVDLRLDLQAAAKKDESGGETAETKES